MSCHFWPHLEGGQGQQLLAERQTDGSGPRCPPPQHSTPPHCDPAPARLCFMKCGSSLNSRRRHWASGDQRRAPAAGQGVASRCAACIIAWLGQRRPLRVQPLLQAATSVASQRLTDTGGVVVEALGVLRCRRSRKEALRHRWGRDGVCAGQTDTMPPATGQLGLRRRWRRHAQRPPSGSPHQAQRSQQHMQAAQSEPDGHSFNRKSTPKASYSRLREEVDGQK